jgi:hypothetical protein
MSLPRFPKTYCSQCGREFGPGDSGFSRCSDHQAAEIKLVDAKQTEAYAEGRADEREYLLGRMAATMAVCGVSAADREYMLASVKDL